MNIDATRCLKLFRSVLHECTTGAVEDALRVWEGRRFNHLKAERDGDETRVPASWLRSRGFREVCALAGIPDDGEALAERLAEIVATPAGCRDFLARVSPSSANGKAKRNATILACRSAGVSVMETARIAGVSPGAVRAHDRRNKAGATG